MLQDHTKQNPSTNITQSLPATMVNQGQVISKETKLDSVFNATEWQNAEMNKWNDVFKSSTKEILSDRSHRGKLNNDETSDRSLYLVS